MKKVITYGTFDLFHKGHYNILKRAKERGDYLIVGVTGESYDIERGKLNVRDSLLTRIRNVEETGFADKIIIEEYQGQKINDIRQYDIDTLVIGSDWRGKFDYLKEYCEVVYLERTKDISSTQIRETSERIFNVGIATDNAQDNSFTEEALYVSGVHVKSAYSSKENVLDEMRRSFELDSFSSDYDEFLDGVDVVYVKSDFENRLELVERAVSAGKHVIAEPPFTLDYDAAQRVFAMAKEKGVVVTERLTLAFLRAFTQLIWFLHGGIIGEVVNAKLVMGGKEFEDSHLLQMQDSAIYAALKVLNETEVEDKFAVRIDKGEGFFDAITLSYKNKLASIELSSSTEPDNGMVVFGTKGSIRVPSDWWNIGYFEVWISGEAHPKRYSFNFEGNGFRYLLQDLLISIKLGRSESTKLSFEDMGGMIKALSEIQ